MSIKINYGIVTRFLIGQFLMTEPLISSPETLAPEALTTFNDLGLQTLLLTAIHALGYQQRVKQSQT